MKKTSQKNREKIEEVHREREDVLRRMQGVLGLSDKDKSFLAFCVGVYWFKVIDTLEGDLEHAS